MIPGSANPLLLASAAEAAGYEIERSLRFNSSDSAYLSRTPASAGNRKTWTWAGWVKRSALGTTQLLFEANSATNSDNQTTLFFRDTDILHFSFNNSAVTVGILQTSQVFRDPSSWYHVVAVFDTSNATNSERMRLFVNGIRITAFGTETYPSINVDGVMNTTIAHSIASDATSPSGVFFSGYLADIHFIDGQALDPTSFGEFDTNGIWQPIEYTGTYGTNGFHLDFSDNSTAAALGTDTSGNSNTWTVNNISVAAGAGNDSLVDVPTNGTETDTGLGGEVRGNYATFNPLDLPASGVYSNGNLEFNHTGGSGVWRTGLSTIAISSGKWYWEMVPTVAADAMIGIVKADWSPTANSSQYWDTAGGYGYLNSNGQKYNNGSGASYGATFTTNDVIGIALDLDAGTLVFYKNGASQGTAFSSLSGTFKAAYGAYQTSKGIANFGQRPFAYTAPSGFKALCTANLDAPVVTKPSEYMDVALYTGNGSTQTISGLEFSPDLVWIKNRAAADSHKLTDTVRGATEELESDTTAAEATNADGLTQFNSDGFDLGADAEYNTNTETYVAWTWDAGSSTVTNTDGSISSQVRANPSAGFSIVTYTGTNTFGASVGHGLNAAPKLILIKNRDSAAGWRVYTTAVDGSLDRLVLDDTGAKNDSTQSLPSSSVFYITDGPSDGDPDDYVAYCFAPVESYSAFGSYTGNGSADGPFVYTGFRPRWILVKRTTATTFGDWEIRDAGRDSYNSSVSSRLFPNSSGAEDSSGFPFDILSNGFKLRTSGVNSNESSQPYIYAAFAENPFALNARAR